MILTRWLPLPCLLIAYGLATPTWADVDVSEYQTRQSVRSDKEREALQADFERQRREEEAHAHAARREEARRQAEEQARREARPYPVKLTEARCTLCHSPLNFETSRHAWPGWAAVVLRMKYFNQALLAWEDMWIISRHLSRTHPADATSAAIEWGSLALAPTLVAIAVAWRRHRKLKPKES